ncbi:hypothetical protein ITP53_42105 [Nonomuraea sp. K274]|uniref:Uncharacterized protein n=1 Tax=Nonomuraea cypriaca TaxID=1187855 RepID=A0A931AKP1_9ACTN|nr:hypothetical protein [Nonomuraea cypriaca]MBF8192164.1 hypothetical protein [Nonomuraea cypriaca]
MSSSPYTYVTLSMRPESAPQLGVSFYTHGLRVSAGMLHSNPRPYLELSSREANVHISTTAAGPVTDADVSTAREIFNAAARYLTECERMHAEQSTATKDADDTAA